MEEYSVIPRERTLANLPPPPPTTGLVDEIKNLQEQNALPVLVILDDDPTGTQTCHGVNVLTVWDQETLEAEFKSTKRGFFILTNSRAEHTLRARELIREVCTAVQQAAAKAGKEIEVVLRGDSTLRGHFPDEPEVAEEVFGKVDGWILAPYFRQGGRLTINDVHYVATGNDLVPAALTPFAKDATFGYKSSNLANYVVEKSKGRIAEDEVLSISLDAIRNGGSRSVADLLMKSSKKVAIVNSVVNEDMEVVVRAIVDARKQGRRYIYRTGAAFVSTRLGIEQIEPLSLRDIGVEMSHSPGGLIIAGSYVPKTTNQLECLIQGRGDKLNVITVQVEGLLEDAEKAEKTISNAADKATELIRSGNDVLLMTSRKLITAGDEAASLRIGSTIAASLVRFLRRVESRPRYIIAKGGITASDAASKGLGMRRAKIVGQAAPGVPLWVCHESSSRWQGLPFVVFPGNVGEVQTLRDLVERWSVPE